MQLILERCPNAYNHGNCSTASSRGPVLLLQSNRFSCSLPTRVTSEAGVASLRSLILMGNMLGNGTKALPDWVHDTENQPFLYLDGLFLAIYLSFLDPEIQKPAEAILGLFGINSSCDQGMSPIWGVRECWPCWCPWALSSPQLCIRWATAPPFFLEDLRIRKIRQVRPMSSWCESGLGI